MVLIHCLSLFFLVQPIGNCDQAADNGDGVGTCEHFSLVPQEEI